MNPIDDVAMKIDALAHGVATLQAENARLTEENAALKAAAASSVPQAQVTALSGKVQAVLDALPKP